MMSRGKQSSSGGVNAASRAGRVSRGPGISSLNNDEKMPSIVSNSSVGAGFNSNKPYG